MKAIVLFAWPFAFVCLRMSTMPTGPFALHSIWYAALGGFAVACAQLATARLTLDRAPASESTGRK